jgi:HNH endonuclease
VDAELDHVIAWSDGGPTCEQNLRSYCTGHHRLKTHAPGWRVQAHADGSLTWITPTGHQHRTQAYDYRPESPGPPPASAQGSPSVSSPPPGDDPEEDPPPF